MEATLKKRLGIFFLIIGVVGLLLIGLQWFIENKIENTLKTELPKNVQLTYSALDFNIFTGSLALHNTAVYRLGRVTNDTLLDLKLEQLQLERVSYWHYFVNNTISLSNVALRNPKIQYRHNPKVTKDSYKPESGNALKIPIRVANFELTNGHIQINNAANDSLLFWVNNVHLDIQAIRVDQKTLKEKIPFAYTNLALLSDSLYVKVGAYDALKAAAFSFKNNQLKVQDILFKTIYSKKQLSQVITKERDHYNVAVKLLQVNDLFYGFRNNKILQIKSPQITISQIDAAIFRDKLVADDPSFKPLYSRMLRHLNSDLALDEVKILDSKISYSEKVKIDRQAGTVNFNDFQASITNVSNTYLAPTKTTLKIKTQFMNHAPLQVNWEFDVNDQTDRFLFQAELRGVQAAYLNKFVEPNLNARLEGALEQTFFTINGTNNLSDIDFKTKYQNFTVNLLRQDGKDKNAFLSDILNIFVPKNSKHQKLEFKEVTKSGIKRNSSQSVFNYIWINVRAGLKKAMTI
ncbi:hypothetical protein ACFSQP_10220 [Bizionia sediminis]|uniref:DUF748 domain-containing protein n=1 Tax=Bizionia sediminis TaxID=1737064 RepID=A0ABW5KW94_9FLAO